MHPLFHSASNLTETVIAAAIQVHRDKGPGLMESIYEWCLMNELEDRALDVTNQKQVTIRYKSHIKNESLRLDLLVQNCLLIEVKAIERTLPLHKAQLMSYMKLLDVPVGLLINFNTSKVTDGISRLILPGSNLE